ncbi:hypothetical protein [Corynebacterium jeddahense]|uniref:Uncharacterized protein n=1 Tax=Corynebacterium jeddahense TaxID=1414719 RepID=A0ABY7UJD2_9CORY|nr:hypothetical protein [Corynebacterium jeddahense]WCZ37829.1 hypothetical protein CJEDD_01010 [Corynebacterium jeddahense]
MKQGSIQRLFDQWVEATVLFEAGPDEFGTDAWHQAIGKMLAFSQMFCELAGDQTTYQKTHFAECKAQSEARKDEILAKHRDLRDDALAMAEAATTHE